MKQQKLSVLLWRGVCKQCPRCGEEGIFQQWNKLKKVCSHCDCVLAGREGNTWFVMYMSTAFITGLFVLYMFLFPTENKDLGRFVLLLLSILAILLTLPYRKGIAVALDYFMEQQENSAL